MTRPRPAWRPPLRDGVGASRVAVPAGPWRRVVDFLAERMPRVAEWPERLARGDVLHLDGRPVHPDAPCVPGTVLWYWRSLPSEPRVPFEIEVLHRDELLVAVDKPHFLPVTPGGRYLQETVLVRLKRLLGIDTLVPLHRLDRETAGVLLFSVRPETRAAYHALLRERRAHKVYEAVVRWHAAAAPSGWLRHRLHEPPGRDFMQMQVLPGEPNAETRFELIRLLPARPDAPLHAHCRLWPITGRKHQLRAQLDAVGHGIVGDRIYPVLEPEPPPGVAPDFSRPLQLLAREIAFDDPVTGGPRRFTSRRVLDEVAAAGD
jgi:tRNA pseudouridine32 synthase/23S rRNA pseudouridine746 synthase